MKTISRAEFKRQMVVGTKWTFHAAPIVVHGNTGQTVFSERIAKRTVVAVKTDRIRFTKPDGAITTLTLAKGDVYETDGQVLRLTHDNGLTLEYHRDAG